MSTDPLDSANMPSSFLPKIIIPLEFIEEQSKTSREDLDIDESGLYMMSKALEEFMRKVMRGATHNGSPVLDYDSISKYIANSEFKALKDFFPERVRLGDIMHELNSD